MKNKRLKKKIDYELDASFLLHKINNLDIQLEQARLHLRDVYEKKKCLIEDYDKCLEKIKMFEEIPILTSS